MRLTDLEPSWFVFETGGPVVGLSFICPHCAALNADKPQRLGILFHPSGADAMEAERDQYIMARNTKYKHIWELTGDDFGSLTLTPSIDASELGHWHGHITNGNIE